MCRELPDVLGIGLVNRGSVPPISREIEPNDNGVVGQQADDLLLANDLFGSFVQDPNVPTRVLANVDGTIDETNDGDWDYYRFRGNPGAQLNLFVQDVGANSWQPLLAVVDRDLNEVGSSPAPGSWRVNSTAGSFPYAGEFYIRVSANSPTDQGDYRLSADLNLAFYPLTPAQPVTVQDLALEFLAADATTGSPWQPTTGTGLQWDFVGDAPALEPIAATNRHLSSSYVFDGDTLATASASFESLADSTRSDASFEFVIKPRDLTGREVVFETGGADVGSSLRLDGDQLIWRVKDGDTLVETSATLTEDDISDFIQVMATVRLGEGLNARLELYVNGNLRSSTLAKLGETLQSWSDADAAHLGGPSGAIGGDVSPAGFTGFDGQLAQMRFYQTAVNVEEVIHNFFVMVNPYARYEWENGDPVTYVNFGGGLPRQSDLAIVLSRTPENNPIWRSITVPSGLDYIAEGNWPSLAGAVSASQLDVTVRNLDPQVSVVVDEPSFERTPFNVSVAATDVPADTLTYTYNFNNGGEVVSSQTSIELVAPAGTYPLVIKVADEDGGETVQTLSIEVLELPPVDLTLTSNGPVDEGSEITFTATAADGDGAGGPLTYLFDFGDGNQLTNQTGVAPHTYADDGDYLVVVTVTDDNGAEATESLTVSINNVAPILDVSGSNNVEEGSLYTLQLSKMDPGTDTLTWHIDWGDGTTDDYPDTATIATHRYRDDSGLGTFRITVTGTDEDGTVGLRGVRGPNLNPLHFTDGVGATGNYYLTTSAALSWQDAQAEATALGGNLVAIESLAEQQFLDRGFVVPAPGSSFWIGMTRETGVTTEVDQDNLALVFDAANPGFDRDQQWQPSGGSLQYGQGEGGAQPAWQFNGTSVPTLEAVTGSSRGFTDAYRFDGTDATQIDPSLTDLQFNGSAASLEFWIKPDDLVGNEVIFEVGDATAGAALLLEDDQLIFRLKGLDTTSANPGTVELETRTRLSNDDLNDFIQVVAVIKPTVGNSDEFITLYVNGQTRDTAATDANQNLNAWTDANNFPDATGLGGAVGEVGSDPNQPGITGFKGLIASMNFYRFRALEDAAVWQNFLAISSPNERYEWVTGEPVNFLNFSSDPTQQVGTSVLMSGVGDGTSRWYVDDGSLPWIGIIELESLANLPLVFDTGLDLTVTNVAPVADAGPDQMSETVELVNLVGNYTDAGLDDTHTFEWQIEAVRAGGNVLVANATTKDFDFQPPASGVYIARFTATDDEGAADTDTTTLEVAVVLTSQADIAVTKTDGVTSAAPSGSVSYTIVVSNAGPSDDPSVSLTDILPADLTGTFTSFAIGGATGNTATGSGDLAETLSMPANSSVTYIVVASIDPGATGTLSNTATVSGSFDPNPANDRATDDDTVLIPLETKVTLVGNTLTIVDVNGGTSNDNLFVTRDNFNYNIQDTGGLTIDVSSIPGAGGSGTSSVTVPLGTIDGLNVTLLGGDDNLVWADVGPVSYAGGGVLIDGGTGADTLSYSAPLTADLGNADFTIKASLRARVFGTINVDDGNVSIMGNATGTTAGNSPGVDMNATITSHGTGDIMVTGRGGADGGTGVVFDGGFHSTATGPNAGTITLDGRGGSGATGSPGLTFNGGSITSVDGDITITGQGTDGSNLGNDGIDIDGIDRIESIGTGVNAAKITLDGTAGNGSSDSAGIRIFESWLQSAEGDVRLTGIGGSANPSSIASTGVILSNSTVQIDEGSLQINGTAGVSASAGVRLGGGRILSIGSGSVEITAVATGTGPDMKVANTGNLIGGALSNSDVTINADSIEWENLQVQSTGDLTIAPRTAAATIGLGGGAGTLNLDDTELGFLVDGFNSITIGDMTSGTGTVDIDTATFTDPITIAGGTIRDGAGTDIDAGTNSVTLRGNVSPGQSAAILTVNGNFAFAAGATFEAEIMGATPGTEHDQIAVTGAVDINNATLNIDDSGFTAVGTEVFVLVDNAGGAVVGTFNGLPQGSLVTVGGEQFTISYVGGDVTLNAVPNVKDPGFPYVDANDDGFFSEADGDVLLDDGELNDGFFDTLIPEGPDYTAVILGAGLVIHGAALSSTSMNYLADGNLIVNTNLTASPGAIALTSRTGDINLDDSAVQAHTLLTINAAQDIIATDDVLRTTGSNANIILDAGGNIDISGTTVEARKDVTITAAAGDIRAAGAQLAATHQILAKVALSAGADVRANGVTINAKKDVDIDAGGSIVAPNSTLNAMLHGAGKIDLQAGQSVDVSGSPLLQAYDQIVIDAADGDVNAAGANLSASRSYQGLIDVDASNDINVDNASIVSRRMIDLNAGRDMIAAGATLDANYDALAIVTLAAGRDVRANGVNINAKKDVTINAGSNIVAPNSTLNAMLHNAGKIDLQAGQSVDVSGSPLLQAYDQIVIDAAGGDVNAAGANLLASRSYRGLIDVDASNDINVDNASIVSRRMIDLNAGRDMIAAGATLDANYDALAIVTLAAGRDVRANGVNINAKKDVTINAGSNIVAPNSTLNAMLHNAGKIDLQAGQSVDVSGSPLLQAYDQIVIDAAGGDVNAAGANLLASGSYHGLIDIDASNDINVDNASIVSRRTIDLNAARDIRGDGAELDANFHALAIVALTATNDVSVIGATIDSKKDAAITAGNDLQIDAAIVKVVDELHLTATAGSVSAIATQLRACGNYYSEVKIAADVNVDLTDAIIRARALIDIMATDQANLTRASIGITHAGANNATVTATDIDQTDAVLKDPDGVTLIGDLGSTVAADDAPGILSC